MDPRTPRIEKKKKKLGQQFCSHLFHIQIRSLSPHHKITWPQVMFLIKDLGLIKNCLSYLEPYSNVNRGMCFYANVKITWALYFLFLITNSIEVHWNTHRHAHTHTKQNEKTQQIKNKIQDLEIPFVTNFVNIYSQSLQF